MDTPVPDSNLFAARAVDMAENAAVLVRFISTDGPALPTGIGAALAFAGISRSFALHHDGKRVW
jgi:hypothetical protein